MALETIYVEIGLRQCRRSSPFVRDPAQVLSWEIYNLSRQIDQYLNEFISELQQNTPPTPSIYYYPIRFEENLETGEQILDVVPIDIASIHY